MGKFKGIVILANLILLLSYINWSIAAKEDTLQNGRLVLLELAPVDPRSLMQGDYMRLNYAVGRDFDSLNQQKHDKKTRVAKRGYCIVKVDGRHVARLIRFQDSMQPLKTGEQAVKYFTSGSSWRNLRLGAESYFFEEGTGKIYEQAKYGGLKVDDQGNSVLSGLYNEAGKLIR
jgi:uncharacterized membrane-anchored protein